MLELNADKIKTYQTCSLLYKYRYLEEQYEPVATGPLVRTRFENILKRVLTFYFYQKQDSNQPSLKSMLNRFQKLWFGEGYTPDDIFTEQTNPAFKAKTDKIYLAANTIDYFIKFYEDFDSGSAIPMLIREDFSVPLTKDIKVCGIFDLVLKDGSDYSVIKWRANSSMPLRSAEYFIDFAILDHAFRYRMEGKEYNVKYYIYDFTSVSSGLNLVEVDPEDKNTLTYWANTVQEDEVHAPRRGLTTHCRGCHFDSPCSKYSITKHMITAKV